MPVVDLCIGSRPSVPATTVTVTANAVQAGVAFPAGDYYLTHGTASLSLLAAFATALDTHPQLAGSTAVLARSGHQRIANATAFSIDAWGSTPTLRDMLGFTGSVLSSTAHVSPNRSPLYWSAGKPGSTSARMGSDGNRRTDAQASRSAPGRVVATRNNEWRANQLRWNFIHVDRMEQVPDVPGTYAYFWDEVIARRRRFYVARGVTEDTTDNTTEMTLPTRIPESIPYIWANTGPDRYQHRRQIERIELYGKVEIDVETATEYG